VLLNADFFKTKHLLNLFDALLATKLQAMKEEFAALKTKSNSTAKNASTCSDDTCGAGNCTEVELFGYVCTCPPAYTGNTCEGRLS